MADTTNSRERDYPELRYRSTLEPVANRWLAVEAIGALEIPISGDDLAALKASQRAS